MKEPAKPNLEGITLEGQPLQPVVEAVERQEISRDFDQEAGRYRKALPKRGGKIRMDTAIEEHGQAKQYSEEDKFGLLLQKGGGIKLEEWLAMPTSTKEKLVRLHKGLKLLKDKNRATEVGPIVERLGMKDYQRFLYMLFQGGYLTRDRDYGHRIIHTKTELAKSLDDEALAVDMFNKNDQMIGYPFPREKRIAKKKQKELFVAEQVDQDMVGGPEETPPEAPLASPASQPVETIPEIPARQAGDSLLDGLDQADALMVEDLVKVLKATRKLMPKLSRKEFLGTFAKGSRFVED